jgi:AraC-like DNA-binding protein
MKAFLKFDFKVLTQTILEEKLAEMGIKFSITGFGEVEFLDAVSDEKLQEITSVFNHFGIEIIENQKTVLVQKIKDAIIEMVFSENAPAVKASAYLADKLNHSYGYLSNLFSEVTYTSIENYIIIQKTEYAKQLIVNDKLSLTEIAYKLNYSSVAHLSTQFKNTTGITPSQFQRIIAKRREIANTK